MYFSKSQLIEMAKDKIVLLNNQKEALNTIAGLISNHMRRLCAIDHGTDSDMLPRESLLLLADTGTGKSYLISKLCEVAGLPFSMISASHLSREGYKGLNLSQAIYTAQKNSGDEEAFLDGIILVDEFDKCRYNGREGNCQPDFLTPIEGRGITVDVGHGEMETIPTNRMLFIFAGAFQGLREQISEKTKTTTIGFGAHIENKGCDQDVLTTATLDDIAEYGFNSELLGRIGRLKYIPPLTVEDYHTLLCGKGASFEKKYGALFDVSGVSFKITKRACDIIANKAIALPSGARTLNAILQEALTESFSQIDEADEINTVTLTSSQGELSVNYKNGKRMHIDWTKEISVELSEGENINISDDIRTETGLNRVCLELLSSARIEDKEDEIMVFYFLQSILRYLLLETNYNDRCMDSITKIAAHVNKTGKQISTFGIMIKDAYERRPENTEIITMRDFFEMFNSVYNMYTPAKLMRYIKNIRRYFRTFEGKVTYFTG